MPEKAVDDVMEAAVGAHFSGLRLEALRLSTSAPSSPSSSPAAAAHAHSNGAVYANGTAELPSPAAARQPFVIGRSSCDPSLLALAAPAGGMAGSAPPFLGFSCCLARSSFVGPDSEFLLDFLKGVSGGTASGKTTVCDMIIQQLHDHRVVLVSQVCVLTAASVAAAGLFWFENVLLLLLPPVTPGYV